MDFFTALDWTIFWQVQRLHTGWLDSLMLVITRLGDGGFLWILLAAVLLCRKRTRGAGIAMAAAMLVCLLVGNFTLKPLIARPRPFQADNSLFLLLPPPSEFSFPSGHTMNGVSASVALWLRERRAGAWALLLAALIAFSRVYLMVHYPSDIFGGALIGLLGGYIGHRLTKQWKL